MKIESVGKSQDANKPQRVTARIGRAAVPKLRPGTETTRLRHGSKLVAERGTASQVL
jgi:hypothetical protein